MSSEPVPDGDTTPEQFVQRAELLADLGRYDDAVAELKFALAMRPTNREALTLLARVHLAAGRPAEALDAVQTVSATAADIAALNARAMALIDLRRFNEAAEIAEQILRLGPEDPDALCTGAALLSESRNGQTALNAAWKAVELAPDHAQTHLVLGLVAARLRQFQLSERAYRQALELEPELADVHFDIGIIHLEQRRYSEALASLADAAAAEARPDGQPGAAEGGAAPEVHGPHPMTHGVRALLHLGAGYALLAPVLVACAAASQPALGRLQAVAMGIIGIGVLAAMVTRLPGRSMATLSSLMRMDRSLAVAVYLVAAAPCLVLLYAMIGSPWPLAAAVAAGFATMLANALADH